MLQSMFKKSKNSPHWNSPRSLELQALLKSVKLEDAEQDEYVQSLSRGGLWSPNENIKGLPKVQRFPSVSTSWVAKLT